MEPARTREEILASPGAANADAAALIAGAAPEVPGVPADTVRLPGGLARDGKVRREAVIRELTGADEEALSRALQGSAFRFADVLIERGTVSVGDLPATGEVLKGLLTGDRDELILAIRCATYGEVMSVEGWRCPACGSLSDISFSLATDVERKILGDPAVCQVFEVPLRRGRTARVRLANGADQDALFENEAWTAAERNTRLLSRCVLSVSHPDGSVTSVPGFPSAVRDLPVTDRQAILVQLRDRQPGPRYNEIKFTHEECKSEVTLALGVSDLFRELLRFL